MSEKTVNGLFDEAKQKMNGFTMLYYFHLANLCIKADPMALLSASVEVNNQVLNLEDVASISIPTEKQFSITPKSPRYIFPICKAIQLEHPEFEMEEKIEKDPITDEDQTVIYYTMPVMNEDRYNACLDYIKVRFEATNTKLDAIFTQISAKIAAKMIGADVENINTAKDKLKGIHEWHCNMAKKFREEKEKEVEEAYQEFLKTATEDAKKTEEKEAAQGKDTMFSISMNDEE